MKRRNALGILLPEGMGTSGPRLVLSGLLSPCFHTNKPNPRSLSSSNNSHKGKGSNNNKTNSNNNNNNNNPGG